MSISYTYDDLVTALKGYAEENDTEFDNNIDDMIGKAETRVLRDLDLEMFEGWLEVTVSANDRVVSKGTDVIVVNEVFIRDPSAQKWMEIPRRSFEYCLLYAPVETTQAVPAYFSEYDEDEIYVVPTPDKTYAAGNARIRATIRPSRLATGNQNTWIGDYLGDLLFQACMVEVHDYLKNQPKMESAALKYQSLTPGIERELEDIKRKKYRGLNTQSDGADA